MNSQMQEAKTELRNFVIDVMQDVNGRTISLGRTPLWSEEQLLKKEDELDAVITSFINAVSVQSL